MTKKRFDLPTVLGIVVMCCAITFCATYLWYESIWPKLSGYEATLKEYQQTIDTYVLAAEGQDTYTEGLAKYTELRQLIDSYFVGEYDEQELNDNMAAGVVAGIGDKWSYYISADEYDDYLMSNQNSYYGIGITITAEDTYGGYEIVRVAEDGPAKDAGLKEGDVLVAVDGQDATVLTLDQVKSMVQGETGTSVVITVMRDGQSMDVTAVRGVASYEIVKYELMDDNVGYVKLYNFEGNAAVNFIGVVETLLEQGAESFVFDVRNNPGGLMTELLTILDYLLPEGETFVQIDYQGNETVYRSGASCLNMPMVVLVNENSYSAAEYFAAILQEDDAAEIVGNNTTGKGYYQVPMELSDGSAAVISVGKYLTPSRRSLAETGITPDYIVEVDDEAFAKIYYGTIEPADDEQLVQALYLAQMAAN